MIIFLQAMEIMDLETRVTALETTSATLTTVPADLTALTARYRYDFRKYKDQLT